MPDNKWWVCPALECTSEVFSSYNSAYVHVRKNHNDQVATSQIMKFEDRREAEAVRASRLSKEYAKEKGVVSEEEPTPVDSPVQSQPVNPWASSPLVSDEEPLITPQLTPSNRLQVSMAERAAGIQEFEEGDQRPEGIISDPRITYTTRGSGGKVPFSVQAHSVFDYFATHGYDGDEVDFFEECFWNYYVLTGLQLSLGVVPPEMKQAIYNSIQPQEAA